MTTSLDRRTDVPPPLPAPVTDGFDATRASLLRDLRGTVLELGPGSGVNLPHYRSDVHWVGLEPDARSRARAEPAMARLRRPARLVAGHAERIPLPGRSVDAVVATFVLCSVQDPDASLAEVRRVLRPGGRFVFLEHVAAPPGTWMRRLQKVCALCAVRPGSCRPDRDTELAIVRAGFPLDVHRSTRPGPFGTRLPIVSGTAW
jgi:SAM-dependent methyltransferase